MNKKIEKWFLEKLEIEGEIVFTTEKHFIFEFDYDSACISYLELEDIKQEFKTNEIYIVGKLGKLQILIENYEYSLE